MVFKDVFDSTKIFFLEKVDSYYGEVYWLPSGSLFNCPEECEKISRHMDLIGDRISHGQLMK
jgi:hypothetical protein